ncbi:MAG: hypothetical protein COA32_02555 [Fluviicola sp.]|nr:MAG: hypothetical protein COA32_02555 [Fluviicola sp.]
MNKFFNIWTLIFTILTIPFVFAVGWNIDFSFFGLNVPGEEFEYADLSFNISAGIIFILGVLKASKKWAGINITRQKKRFVFLSNISRSRLKRVILYNILEMSFHLIFAFFFIVVMETAVFVGLVFVLLFLENLINTLFGVLKQTYSIGITSKAIIFVDRDVKAIYFKGLKKISKHQQTIYFEYVNDLVLHVPTNLIPQEREDEFLETLQRIVDPNKVFYTGF